MITPRQLKQSDTARVRVQFQNQQGYRCAICTGTIATGLVTLDHDHETGHCRGALCGTCNRNEGKVLAAIKYMSRLGHMTRTDPLLWLQKMLTYILHHRANPSGLIHHSFDLKTGKQKPVKRKKVTTKKKKA